MCRLPHSPPPPPPPSRALPAPVASPTEDDTPGTVRNGEGGVNGGREEGGGRGGGGEESGAHEETGKGGEGAWGGAVRKGNSWDVNGEPTRRGDVVAAWQIELASS